MEKSREKRPKSDGQRARERRWGEEKEEKEELENEKKANGGQRRESRVKGRRERKNRDWET